MRKENGDGRTEKEFWISEVFIYLNKINK